MQGSIIFLSPPPSSGDGEGGEIREENSKLIRKKMDGKRVKRNLLWGRVLAKERQSYVIIIDLMGENQSVKEPKSEL